MRPPPNLAAMAAAREALRDALRMMLRNDLTHPALCGKPRAPVLVVIPAPHEGGWRVLRANGAQLAFCHFEEDAKAVASAFSLAPELLHGALPPEPTWGEQILAISRTKEPEDS